MLWTSAILKLAQVIHEGFKNKESTPSCFMDFEKEYDSSGEEDGLMMKLSRLCVNGRMWKKELVTLLNLSSWCLVMVERLFLTVPRGCMWFVIVVFPDHTHYFGYSPFCQTETSSVK